MADDDRLTRTVRWLERWRHRLTLAGGLAGGLLTLRYFDDQVIAWDTLRFKVLFFGFCVVAAALAIAFAVTLAILDAKVAARTDPAPLPVAIAVPVPSAAPEPPAEPAIAPLAAVAPPSPAQTPLTDGPRLLGSGKS